MIIIGVRGIRKVEQAGSFHCPACGSGAPFEQSVIRGWFTIFFIPCIPLFTREGEQVRCKRCGGVFMPGVLNWSPAIPGQQPPPSQPQEEIHQLRPSVHPRTGMPLPPPLPKPQFAGSTVIGYQSNGLATACLVFGILGVLTCVMIVPGFLFALLSVLFGFFAMRRVRQGDGRVSGKRRARAGFACSLVALVIAGGMAWIVTTHRPAVSDKTRSAMSDAIRSLSISPTLQAHGNSAEARVLATRYAHSISALDAVSFSSAGDGGMPKYAVHCELREGKCAFIVQVPHYGEFDKAAEDKLEDMAWLVGTMSESSDAVTPETALCVALKGGSSVGCVMTGKAGGKAPAKSGRIDWLLEPFFEGPLPPATAPPQAGAEEAAHENGADSAGPSGSTGPPPETH